VSKWSKSFSSEMAATQVDEGKAGFQVRYEVRETSIGKGLFLLEPVAKGALIWRYREGENILCFRNEAETRKHLDSMASDADRIRIICPISLASCVRDLHRLDFLEHCFHDGGVLNSILDEGKLVNHSTSPTMGKVDLVTMMGKVDSIMSSNSKESLSSFSLRALGVGEELTENYGTYEYPGWLLEISIQYEEDLSYFDLPTQLE